MLHYDTQGLRLGRTIWNDVRKLKKQNVVASIRFFRLRKWKSRGLFYVTKHYVPKLLGARIVLTSAFQGLSTYHNDFRSNV
jgi:hypothetical protein